MRTAIDDDHDNEKQNASKTRVCAPHQVVVRVIVRQRESVQERKTMRKAGCKQQHDSEPRQVNDNQRMHALTDKHDVGNHAMEVDSVVDRQNAGQPRGAQVADGLVESSSTKCG